jgi:hypothetical protein
MYFMLLYEFKNKLHYYTFAYSLYLQIKLSFYGTWCQKYFPNILSHLYLGFKNIRFSKSALKLSPKLYLFTDTVLKRSV